MENKEKQSVISNMWKNWCDMDSDSRGQVASKLGPLGQVLSIAANVQKFMTAGIEGVNQQNQPEKNATSVEEDDETIIEAEFEEVD